MARPRSAAEDKSASEKAAEEQAELESVDQEKSAAAMKEQDEKQREAAEEGVEKEGRVSAGEGQQARPKGEGPDRSPSEVFDGPVHELNLAPGQSAFLNDQKKRELEEAGDGKYEFVKIPHHGTLSPVEGDHAFSWEVRRAGDASRLAAPENLDAASDDQHLNPDQEPEGLKANANA